MMNGERPKMLLFSHLCSTGFVTGAEKLLILFARELNLRYQCVLVVPTEGVIAAQARSLGIHVIVFEIPLSSALYLGSPSVAGRLESRKRKFVYQRLLALLVRERPSCVFVNTCVHPLPAIAAKSLGIPTVWSLMETIAHSPHRDLALDAITHASDIIVGISRATLQPFSGHPGEEKTHMLSPYVAYDELDPAAWPLYRSQLRQQYGWPETHCVMGYVTGAIYPQKGLEPFIRAALSVRDGEDRARFLVVGNPVDENYFQMCRSLVCQAGMDDRFGWIRFEENIQRIYPAMDIVVVPSLQAEGFGMTAMEGMQFGKPVVAFSSGGLAEILEATGNGSFLVPDGDVSELASRMEWLMSDDEWRGFVGNRNEREVQTAYGVAALRAQLDHLQARLPIRSGFPSPLIRGRSRTVYLVENGRRRPFVSKKALLEREFRFNDVRRISDKELKRIPRGSSIREWSERKTARRSSRRKRTGTLRRSRKSRARTIVSKRRYGRR